MLLSLWGECSLNIKLVKSKWKGDSIKNIWETSLGECPTTWLLYWYEAYDKGNQ